MPPGVAYRRERRSSSVRRLVKKTIKSSGPRALERISTWSGSGRSAESE